MSTEFMTMEFCKAAFPPSLDLILGRKKGGEIRLKRPRVKCDLFRVVMVPYNEPELRPI